MTDTGAETAGAPSGDDGAEEVDGVETAESIADEIRDEIRLGHVQDDVSHVLEERLRSAYDRFHPRA